MMQNKAKYKAKEPKAQCGPKKYSQGLSSIAAFKVSSNWPSSWAQVARSLGFVKAVILGVWTVHKVGCFLVLSWWIQSNIGVKTKWAQSFKKFWPVRASAQIFSAKKKSKRLMSEEKFWLAGFGSFLLLSSFKRKFSHSMPASPKVIQICETKAKKNTGLKLLSLSQVIKIVKVIELS